MDGRSFSTAHQDKIEALVIGTEAHGGKLHTKLQTLALKPCELSSTPY